MGATCSDCDGSTDPKDNRPYLKVTVLDAIKLSKINKKKEENEIYVECKFGPLKGNRNDITKRTKTVKMKSDATASWNEDVYIRIPTFPITYSLQVSVYNVDNPVLKELVGKVVILYEAHGQNYQNDQLSKEEVNRIRMENNENLLKTKFLPGAMYQEYLYNLQLEKLKNHGFRAEMGELKIRCTFVENMENDSETGDQEQAGLLKNEE